MMKRIVMLALCLVLGIGVFAGCRTGGGAGKAENEIKVWGSSDDQTMLQTMIEDFKRDNPTLVEGKIITLSVMGENDAKTEMLKDINAGADVFAFSNDQIGELVDNSALYNLTSATHSANVKERNTASAVASSTVNNKLYAYPSSAESYYLFYNKDIYTDQDVKSLDSMIAKNKGAGVKTLVAQFNEGYYTPMFFAGAGCTLYGTGGSDPTNCTWNNANGELVAKYMKTLKAKGVDYATETDMKTQFTNKTAGAIVTGTWNYVAMSESLGDKLGLAVLPKASVEGIASPIQMTPFNGMKLYGVNSTTKHADLSIALANYLTSEASQLVRFNTRGYLPTNKALATNEAITAKTQIKVEVDSIAISISKPSHAQGGKFWEASATLVKDLMDNASTVNTDAKIKEVLNKFVTDIITVE